MRDTTKQLRKALSEKLNVEVMYCKGCFITKDGQRYSINQARRLTGIEAPERQNERLTAWGDMATIVMMNKRG